MAGGVNPYLYTINNPINLIDPYGLLSDPTGAYTQTLRAAGPTAIAAEATIGGTAIGTATVYTGGTIVAFGGGYLVGSYIESKTGIGAAIGEWFYDLFHDDIPIYVPQNSIDSANNQSSSATESGCTNQNKPDSQKCRSLARKIKNIRKEIFEKRIPDLENNPGELPERIGPGEQLRDTVRGHRKLLHRQLRRLRELERRYDKECK